MVLKRSTQFYCTLYLNQDSGKYLEGFQSYWVDMINIQKFTKRHNSYNIWRSYGSSSLHIN